MGARNEIMPISARTALRSTLLDVSLKIELDCRCLNPQTRKSIRVNCFKPLTVSFTNQHTLKLRKKRKCAMQKGIIDCKIHSQKDNIMLRPAAFLDRWLHRKNVVLTQKYRKLKRIQRPLFSTVLISLQRVVLKQVCCRIVSAASVRHLVTKTSCTPAQTARSSKSYDSQFIARACDIFLLAFCIREGACRYDRPRSANIMQTVHAERTLGDHQTSEMALEKRKEQMPGQTRRCVLLGIRATLFLW